MKPSEYMDFINEIEEKFPVDRWIIDNIHIWPLVRNTIAFKVDTIASTITNNLKGQNKYINFFREIIKYFLAYFLDYNHNAKSKKNADIVFLSKTVCRTKIKNKWYDKFTDSLIDLYSKNTNYYVFEYSSNGEYYFPRNRDSKYIQLYYDFLRIKNILTHKNKNTLDKELLLFAEFKIFLKQRGFESLIDVIDKTKHDLGLIKELTFFFRRELLKVKPSLAFVISYYEIYGYAFCLACNQLGIPCIDIQHGSQGELHVAYGRWNKVPPNGYNLLPTHFWCWSLSEVNVINRWSKELSIHKAFSGGNIWEVVWSQGNNDFFHYYNQIILNLKKHINSSVFILYTLQPGIEIPEWLLSSMRDSSSNWFWWVRLHPTMLKEKKEIKKKFINNKIINFEIDQASELPLMAILRHTDIHITASSSAILEAQKYNIPSIIIHPFGIEYYQEQINSGWAKVAFTREQLLGSVEFLLLQKGQLHTLQQKFSVEDALTLLQEIRLSK